MKATELIAALEALVKEHGDLPVVLGVHTAGAFGHFDADAPAVGSFDAHHYYFGDLEARADPPATVVVLTHTG